MLENKQKCKVDVKANPKNKEGVERATKSPKSRQLVPLACKKIY